MATAAESDAVRSGATDKSLDTAGVRRLETLWAGRTLSNLFVVRLVRNAATACDDQLDLGPNSPRQNDADLTPDALDRVHFSWNRERALFSFILSMFFTPNRVHFG